MATLTPTTRLPHEYDDDACCIHCGADGAESWHLTKYCGYEELDTDRWCVKRTEAAQREAYRQQQRGATQ